MLILILGIVIAAIVAFLMLWIKYPSSKCSKLDFDKHDLFATMPSILGLVVIVLVVEICRLSTTVATESTIDSKIEMYQEENTNIEQDIDKIVKEYLEHEHDTFANLKTEESSITLVTLFPELKSDTLVQQQLEIYVENNAKIKKLKEEKIDIAKIKWILYFGK